MVDAAPLIVKLLDTVEVLESMLDCNVDVEVLNVEDALRDAVKLLIDANVVDAVVIPVVDALNVVDKSAKDVLMPDSTADIDVLNPVKDVATDVVLSAIFPLPTILEVVGGTIQQLPALHIAELPQS